MSNFQQRNMCYAALWYDFDIIITDYTQLFAAMPALNPTVLIAPPVLYQMIHAEYEKYPGWKKSLWTVLGARSVAAAVRARCAGRWRGSCFRISTGSSAASMRLLVTGMAPIRRNMGKFFEQHAAAAVRILRHGGGRLASPTAPPVPGNMARWARCCAASNCPSSPMAKSSSAAKHP